MVKHILRYGLINQEPNVTIVVIRGGKRPHLLRRQTANLPVRKWASPCSSRPIVRLALQSPKPSDCGNLWLGLAGRIDAERLRVSENHFVWLLSGLSDQGPVARSCPLEWNGGRGTHERVFRANNFRQEANKPQGHKQCVTASSILILVQIFNRFICTRSVISQQAINHISDFSMPFSG